VSRSRQRPMKYAGKEHKRPLALAEHLDVTKIFPLGSRAIVGGLVGWWA